MSNKKKLAVLFILVIIGVTVFAYQNKCNNNKQVKVIGGFVLIEPSSICMKSTLYVQNTGENDLISFSLPVDYQKPNDYAIGFSIPDDPDVIKPQESLEIPLKNDSEEVTGYFIGDGEDKYYTVNYYFK